MHHTHVHAALMQCSSIVLGGLLARRPGFHLTLRLRACSGGLELLFDKHKEVAADVPLPANGTVSRPDSTAHCHLRKICIVPMRKAPTWQQSKRRILHISYLQLDIRELLPWMRDNLLTERPELFMKEDSV